MWGSARRPTASARIPTCWRDLRRWIEWILEVPAQTFLEVTPDRLLPLTTRPVEGHEYDFRAPASIGSTRIDHAFTDIVFDNDGDGRARAARVVVRDPGGTGVGMAWDRSCAWVQLHTGDKHRRCPTGWGSPSNP